MEEEEEVKEEFWGYEDLEDCECDSSISLSPPPPALSLIEALPIVVARYEISCTI